MRIAAVLAGLLGSLIALYVGALLSLGEGIAGVGGTTGSIKQTVYLLVPIAALVSAILAWWRPRPAGIVLLASAILIAVVLGFNTVTAAALVLVGAAGVLSLKASAAP